VLRPDDRLGAYIGFTALHAASRGVEVYAFEPNPAAHVLLERNVAANPAQAAHMHLFRFRIDQRHEDATLYVKAYAESGASLHRTIERGSVIQGMPAVTIHLRDAAAVLRGLGVDRRILLKIDIEGAEYQVLPAIAPLLAEGKPWLHVSFHPFNLVHDDPYRTELLRLRGMPPRHWCRTGAYMYSRMARGKPSTPATGWSSYGTICCARNQSRASARRNTVLSMHWRSPTNHCRMPGDIGSQKFCAVVTSFHARR
jgi:FkbM family methyltransferase